MRMKRKSGIILFLAILSFISGYLMSKASLVGRAGISLFYREYTFLKVWWKGALLILASFGLLFIVQGLIQRLGRKKAITIHIIACILAMSGLYFTFSDFRHSVSHHLLGERFHLGMYLFWIGWIIISLSYLLQTPGGLNID